MIINDDSSIVNKQSFKLIDDPRVIIYNCHRFIIQAPGVNFIKLFCRNLHPKWCNLSKNLRQYGYSSANYAEKSFMKLASEGKLLKS